MFGRSFLNRVAVSGLLVLFGLALPAPAAEHQHAAPVAAGDVHQHHGEASPAKPSTQAGHVHPAPTTGGSDVGLDEKLGGRIPLELAFMDETGTRVRLAELISRPTVIAPVYYRCPNVCHFLQGELAQVLPQLNLAAGSDYQVLSISFDDTETPELAARTRDTYLAAAGQRIPATGWRFLTGSAEAIQAFTGAIGFRFQRVGSEFQHPVAIVVVTPDGTIARYLHGTRILPKDLALALMEAREGHVGTTIRKMVQYCFTYDPQQKTYVFNVLRVSATVILITLGAFLAFLLLTGKKHPKDRQS